MDFLVECLPREVLDRAETYLWRRGFHVSPSERTENASLFTRIEVPREGGGLLKRVLSAFISTPTPPIPIQKIRLLASEAGEGRTRLTVMESSQGELPDEWTYIESELERWVVEELGGTYWPL